MLSSKSGDWSLGPVETKHGNNPDLLRKRESMYEWIFNDEFSSATMFLIGAKTAAWTFIFEDWVRKSGLYNRLPKPGTLILHEFSGLNTLMQNKNIDRT